MDIFVPLIKLTITHKFSSFDHWAFNIDDTDKSTIKHPEEHPTRNKDGTDKKNI